MQTVINSEEMANVYREEIIETYNYLLSVHQELFLRILNTAMNGEYSEINKTFGPGDSYDFDIEQFKGTNDINLNKLIDFFEELETLMNSLANINNIQEEELAFGDLLDDEDDEE